MFNPNELLIERIRSVEEYDPATAEILGRYSQVEDPTLSLTADSTEVTDAMGVPIAEFYNAQKGEFSFTNSLFSIDLAASQFGAKKEVASESNKIIVPVSETITIGSDHTVTLKYVPVGTTGAEVKYVYVVNANNTFGTKYEVSSVAGEGKFTIDAKTKTITLPDDATGRVFVNYEKESTSAVSVTKRTDGVPEVRSLLIHVLFHDPCNKNIVYSGVIRCPRAQIDPSSVEVSFKADGKHPAKYKLQKEYCAEDGKLFDIIVDEA